MTVRTFTLIHAPFPLVKVAIALHLVLLVVGVVVAVAHLFVAVAVVVVVIVVVVDDVVTRGRNGPFPLLIFHHGVSRELEVNLEKK